MKKYKIKNPKEANDIIKAKLTSNTSVNINLNVKINDNEKIIILKNSTSLFVGENVIHNVNLKEKDFKKTTLYKK